MRKPNDGHKNSQVSMTGTHLADAFDSGCVSGISAFSHPIREAGSASIARPRK